MNMPSIQGRVQRQSNFELLRIVAMMMILFLHAFKSPDILTRELVSVGIVSDFFLESISMVSVDAFVLISGYFSIRWKRKSIFSLIYQTYFFVILIYIAFALWGGHNLSIKDIVLGLNALHLYWFIGSYVGLYLFSPILNAFCESVSRSRMKKVLIILFIWQTYYNIFHPDGIFGLGFSIMMFCNLYLLGRYFKMYGVLDNIRYSKTSLCIIFLLLCVIITAIVLFFMIFIGTDGNSIIGPLWLYSNYNPLNIIAACILFAIFAKISLKSHFVNWIGGSVLSIYLLHLHPMTRPIYTEITSKLYHKEIYEHYLLLLLLFLVIFVVAVLVDKLRISTFNILYKLIER